MLVWTALPILILSALACGPFHDSIPAALEPLAQLTTVLSLFVLVCAMEAGGRSKDSGG
jgi:predicted permease